LKVNGLTGLLLGEKQKLEESNPDMMSMLNTLLDVNKDGSTLDDILGMLGIFLGSKK